MLGIAAIFGTYSLICEVFMSRFITLMSDCVRLMHGIALRVWTELVDWTGIGLCK